MFTKTIYWRFISIFVYSLVWEGSYLKDIPGQPKLLNEINIGNGSVAIVGYLGKLVNIGCKIQGGTNLSVQIVVGNISLSVATRNGTFFSAVTFDESYDLKEVRCEVSSSAQVSPNVSKSRLYVAVLPSEPSIHMGNLKEGHPINVTCSSQRGRPAPRLAFSIEGTEDPDIETSPLVTQDSVTSISLLHLKRSWNGKMLKCCTLSDIHMDQCSEKPINYQFPPDAVSVQQEMDKGSIKPTYISKASCLLSKVNTECTVAWKVGGEPRQSGQITILSGTTTGTSMKNDTFISDINMTKADDGKELTCVANCDRFKPKTSAIILIIVPYEPMVTLNTQNEVYVTEGEEFVANCTVDSYPEANITWLNGSRQESSHSEPCGPQSVCLKLERVSSDLSGVYICVAQNNLSRRQEKRLKIVVHSRSKIEDDPESTDYLVPVVALSAVVAVLVCIIVVIIVVKKMRSASDTKEPAAGIPSVESVQGTESGSNFRNGESDGAACYATLANNDTYAQPVPKALRKKSNSNADGKQDIRLESEVYSQALPRSQRGSDAATTNAAKVRQTEAVKELVYVDLELRTPAGGQPSGMSRNPDDVGVEYMDIDFTKKADRLSDDDDADDSKV